MQNAFICCVPRTRMKKSISYLVPKLRQISKIDSLFMTKTAEKPYPLGPIAQVREYSEGRRKGGLQ